MEDKETEYNKKVMEQCVQLAKQGINLEKLYEDLEPFFNICNQIFDLAIKNYNFLCKKKDGN